MAHLKNHNLVGSFCNSTEYSHFPLTSLRGIAAQLFYWF